MSDFIQTPYPGIAEYTKEEMVALAEQRGSEALLHEIQKRERVIQLAKDDPLEYGVKLDPWKDADRLLEQYDELLILGGNRSGKTEYAARTVANKMAHGDSTNTWCLHTTLPSSIEMQQPVVRRYLLDS